MKHHLQREISRILSLFNQSPFGSRIRTILVLIAMAILLGALGLIPFRSTIFEAILAALLVDLIRALVPRLGRWLRR